MSSSEASDLSMKFKSKKPLTLTPKSKPGSVISDPILTAPTPDRPWQPAPPRVRNRNVALSIADIRRAAVKSVGEKKDQSGSARRQIAFQEESPKKKKAPKKLPEKYEILGEFFNCLDSSIRLLKAKGVKPLFRNICPAVEDLTDRRFTYSHLAQLKYILPEVIEIKKELVFDERTSCLKPDLHVALNVQALEIDGESKFEGGGIAQLKKTLNLRRVFRDRLVEVSRFKPESAPGKLASTPKLVSTPARLMSSTPAPQLPKRCFMSPEDSSPNKLVRRPPRTRSLKFDTPVKSRNAEDEVLDMDDASIDKDILDILPGDLLQSLREKERKATEERTPAITQAKRREKMIAKLPKLFNMIHFLFQSMSRSFITKQELVHKIIWNHCDMIDREDVEELLNLLLELVPDWISEKKLGGELLAIYINKRSIPEAIRSRLEGAF
ncbi:hypothetical protein ACLB2K_015915 [Fragaria x ananassa]